MLYRLQGRNLLTISLFHTPLHMLGLCLFLESIEHDFMKALMIHTHNQIVTKHSWQSGGLMILRLWVQTPLGTIFDKIYFVLCNFRSVRNAYREKLKCWHFFLQSTFKKFFITHQNKIQIIPCCVGEIRKYRFLSTKMKEHIITKK